VTDFCAILFLKIDPLVRLDHYISSSFLYFFISSVSRRSSFYCPHQGGPIQSSDASELQDALASIAGDRENDELDLTLEEPKRAKKRNAGLELRRVGPKAKQRHREEVVANQRANAKRKRKESDEMGPPKKMLRGRAEKREGSDLENDPFAPPHKVINTYGMW
jgi:hypothetical protein